MTVKVFGDDYDGKYYTLIEMEHPNTGPALHIHSKAPEAYYVLDGQYSIRCTNETYQARPGDFVFIPKGLPHNYHSGPKVARSW
jgi:mannose-6-phosphate isomerase-like protein (cupin superfamily)